MKAVYPNLCEQMEATGVTAADLAAECNISKFRCLLKCYGLVPWKCTEVIAICRLLGQADAESLFVRLDIIS